MASSHFKACFGDLTPKEQEYMKRTLNAIWRTLGYENQEY